LARDAKALKALRDRLARNRPSCALFDTARFTRNLEAAYATMWDIACGGEAPRGFSVQKPPR
jgi:predicted O-linked N-acetylglucosamine transferase (SPINDLY family)